MNKQIKPHYTYADAEEKYVKNIMLYGMIRDEESVFELYYDEKFEHAVDGKDLLNLFLKGFIVVSISESQTLYHIPYMFTLASEMGVAMVSVFVPSFEPGAMYQTVLAAPIVTE